MMSLFPFTLLESRVFPKLGSLPPVLQLHTLGQQNPHESRWGTEQWKINPDTHKHHGRD